MSSSRLAIPPEFRAARKAGDKAAHADFALESVRRLHEDRWFAHAHLFANRHPDASARAHREMVAAINRPIPRLSIEGFRGIGKTTYTEETALMKAVFREFHNLVIIGPSFARACDRVTAIRNEIDTNPYFAEDGLFGKLKGETWADGKIVLGSDIMIQALGREQSITGLKFLQWRPDAFIIDDIEDPEEERTDAEREKTWRWLKQTFQPCLDDALLTWGRFLGTRRGKNSLPERLENDRMPVVKFPIESVGENGERTATWPAKFPLDKIDTLREDYRGDLNLYEQEFMCRASSDAARVFKREMFRYEERIRTWEAVYGMVDPARTSHGNAAATGYAIWSWVKNRLVVWACDALFLAPDEIVALAFDLCERYDLIQLGVERDGLEQFLLQPLRHEQVKRGVMLPLKPIAAISGTQGRGQTRFIEGLQPYFQAREVIFAQPFPALEAQLLSFPHGIRDAANALAYAPTLRPAQPIYDGFDPVSHVVEGVDIAAGQPIALAANATGGLTCAIMVQAFEGTLRILADWVYEGSPAERVADIAQAAAQVVDSSRFVAVPVPRPWDDMLKGPLPDRMLARPNRPAWIVPQLHSDRHMNVGLMQAVRAIPNEVRVGGTEVDGTLYIRDALARTVRGMPVVEVSPAAKWTLRALAGGYTRGMIRGRLQDSAEEGPYRVLMEGLEAFCGSIRFAAVDNDEDTAQNYRVDERSGRRYASAMPMRTR